jgi:hypothetical protein
VERKLQDAQRIISASSPLQIDGLASPVMIRRSQS